MSEKRVKTMDYDDLLKDWRANPLAIIEDAKQRGATITGYLNMLRPPGGERASEKAPTFKRLLKSEELAYRSEPLAGVYASPISDFFRTESGRALFGELCYGVARSVWYGDTNKYNSKNRDAIIYSNEAIPGEILHPYVDRPEVLLDRPFEPAIPMSEIVAFTNFVDGDTYRSLYFERDSEEQRMSRINEGTDIPSGTLKQHENVIDLPKRGRGIQITRELLRENARVRVDRIMFQVQMIALESQVDLLEDAIDCLRYGDGNEDTVPDELTRDLTAETRLDPDQTTGALSKPESWMAFEMRFEPPFILTRVLTRFREALELKRLTLFSSGTPPADTPNDITANALQLNVAEGAASPFFPQLQPINPVAGIIRIGHITPRTETGSNRGFDDSGNSLSVLPKGDILGFDHRLALERVVEVGSEVQQIAEFVRNQTYFLGITENSNFAIFQTGAVKYISDWNTP